MTSKGMELASLTRVQKLLLDQKRHSHDARGRVARSLAWVVAMAFVFVAGASAEPASSLDVKGMTFVASREDGDAVIIHAEQARFDTDAKKAYLLVVDATVPPNAEQSGLEMRCDSGVVDLETNDFRATGNVIGHTDSGEVFTTDWVQYDHASGVLFTQAPVLITDDGTTIRGGGFNYDLAERRFQLIGGARVVQTIKDETPTPETGS